MCTGAATPVPVTVAAAGEFEASLVKEALTVAKPLDCGVKVTVKFTLWPEGMVTGNANPVMENSELPTLTEDTVTLAPVALSVPVCVPLVPTVTFPTPMVAGLTLSCPGFGCVVPAPLNAMVRLGLEASLARARLPLALADVGVKTTLKVVLCAGARINGRSKPVALKSLPVKFACVMVRLLPPVLVSVSVALWLVPICTLPKLMLVGAALKVPEGESCAPEAGLPVLIPWQPTRPARASTTTSAFQRVGRWPMLD